nr:hypothetical protein [uncultured bacterium]
MFNGLICYQPVQPNMLLGGHMGKFPSVTVKETFKISGHGTGIIPDESLPSSLQGSECIVEISMPDGTIKEARAFVEAILKRAIQADEMYTFRIDKSFTNVIPHGSTITIREIRTKRPPNKSL